MKVIREKPIVAIDGPAGSGKSTVAKQVARKMGFSLIDTGAIYRSVALTASRRQVSHDDDEALAEIVATLDLSFRFTGELNHVYLKGEDVSRAIRTPDMDLASSNVSARPVVRQGLLSLQRRLAGQGGAVLEGRDIGTVVFPDAEVKVFLTASVKERALRRYREQRDRGLKVDLKTIEEEVVLRDHQDSTRALAPLCRADDAVEIDTDDMTIDQVVASILDLIRSFRP